MNNAAELSSGNVQGHFGSYRSGILSREKCASVSISCVSWSSPSPPPDPLRSWTLVLPLAYGQPGRLDYGCTASSRRQTLGQSVVAIRSDLHVGRRWWWSSIWFLARPALLSFPRLPSYIITVQDLCLLDGNEDLLLAAVVPSSGR
jgi:hypothetical protein